MTADILTITSTRGPDDEPVCELAWKGDHWYAPVADVRAAVGALRLPPAEWSSSAARWAHNPEVARSNRVSATNRWLY
jgi:hypothetical protein